MQNSNRIKLWIHHRKTHQRYHNMVSSAHLALLMQIKCLSTDLRHNELLNYFEGYSQPEHP